MKGSIQTNLVKRVMDGKIDLAAAKNVADIQQLQDKQIAFEAGMADEGSAVDDLIAQKLQKYENETSN